MDGPAANTRSRKRARENDSHADASSVCQSVDASTSQNGKRQKLSALKLTFTSRSKSPATSEPVQSAGISQTRPNTQQSGQADKNGKRQQQAPEEHGGETEEEDDEGEDEDEDDEDDEDDDSEEGDVADESDSDDIEPVLLPAYPRMPKPENLDKHVAQEDIEKLLALPNLENESVHRELEDWKLAANRGNARFRRNLWRATRKALSLRDMTDTQWETEYWEDTDAAASQVWRQVRRRRGQPAADKALGERRWVKEDKRWVVLANSLT